MSNNHHWKQRERNVAGLFGARRNRCSGSSGRPDVTTSDSTHPTLYIETKTLAKVAVRTLMIDAARKAAKEGKVPVLAYCEKGKPGAILCVRQEDLERLVVEYAAANHERLHPLIVTAIRAAEGIVDPAEIALPQRETA